MNEFHSYVGPPQIHDGTILSLDTDFPVSVTVRIRGGDAREIVLVFDGVRAVRQRRAVGMVLSGLAELGPACSARRFAFVSRDDDDDATLEIDAERMCDETPTAAS
jgi:hypothetical protein